MLLQARSKFVGETSVLQYNNLQLTTASQIVKILRENSRYKFGT